MPRKATGDRPLTGAEREARRRQRRKAECEALMMENERLKAEIIANARMCGARHGDIITLHDGSRYRYTRDGLMRVPEA